ncbi:MAG: DUF2244 domain-containing protein [Alphaproteobacteria bacterium]|nr:DUF2244 domain-containing protein [Alphaproteobacteria bacterium]
MAPVATPSASPPFETVLVPHRSLSPEGFKWLIRGAIAANVAIALPMLVWGAWPVFGFMGLDVWLLWFLFRRSYATADRSETIFLGEAVLTVRQTGRTGSVEETCLDLAWLRVEAGARLELVSRDRRIEIGRFLAPEQRARVADDLARAIAAARRPRFDHRWD